MKKIIIFVIICSNVLTCICTATFLNHKFISKKQDLLNLHEQNIADEYQKGYEAGLWGTGNFLAKVVKAEGNVLHVQRFEENNQLEYVFNVGTENTLIMSSGQVIDVSEIKEGDVVSVTFYGEIIESDPAVVKGVLKVIVKNYY